MRSGGGWWGTALVVGGTVLQVAVFVPIVPAALTDNRVFILLTGVGMLVVAVGLALLARRHGKPIGYAALAFLPVPVLGAALGYWAIRQRVSPFSRRRRDAAESLRALGGLGLIVFILLAIALPVERGALAVAAFVIGLAFYVAGWVHARPSPGHAAIALRVVVDVLVVGVVIVAVGAAIITQPPGTQQSRARTAKAQADVRALVSAIEHFAAHCGGLPAAGAHETSDCTAKATGATGPLALPSVLLRPQRNANGVVAGPFINTLPRLPPGWTGHGTSYAYYVTASGGFIACATGDGAVAHSEAGKTSCP